MNLVRTLVAGVALLLGGCGTIVNGFSDGVTINSRPDGASVIIVDEAGEEVFRGSTPASLDLVKARGWFAQRTYTLTVSKPGYQTYQTPIKPRPSLWFIIGNLFLPFVGQIGWVIIDPLTGGMWTIDPDKFDASLLAQTTRSEDGTTLTILLLEDVPEEMRGALVSLE
jgi:hypothetical protein